MKSVSLILCTYNRARLLSRVLDSIVNLSWPADASCEIIIVDNNSQDDSRKVVESFSSKMNVLYAVEKKQGKTYALNRALSIANGELLLFTDDDTILHPGWASAFIDAAARVPDAGWFGGRAFPLWPLGKPKWLYEDTFSTLRGYFCAYDLGHEERHYREDDLLPIGASMAVRKSTFDEIGSYREDLGPRGDARGVGDDTELIMRAISKGIRGYYVPGAIVDHYVPPERFEYSSFFRYGIRKGADQRLMAAGRDRKGSYVRAALQLIRALPQALRGRRDRVSICLLNAGIEIGLRKKRQKEAPGSNEGITKQREV